MKVPASALDHRRFWEAMDALDADSLEVIWHRATERTMAEFSLDKAGLVLDMTNVSTYVDSANERNTIAQRGHAKNKRHDLRLVGLSLVVTADGAVPIAHHAYAGNRPDVTQFQRAIQMLRRQLGEEDHDLTVVFDAGMDSKDNLAALEGLHFVGSVPPHQHPDLLSVADSEYRVVEGLSGVRAVERSMQVLGRDLRVVVTHSDEFHQKQSRGFDQTLAKATARLADLARRLSGGRTRRGRKAVEDEIKEICSARWVSRVLTVTLNGTSGRDFALDFAIDAQKRAALEAELFGKRVLVTDRVEWTLEQVVTCRCRECHLWPATSTLTPGPDRCEHPAITLSFLYLALCRALQLIRLVGRSDTDLAVEIVMLRHEVAVLRRQVTDRPSSRQIEPCWPGCHDWSPAGVTGTSSSNRQPFCAGTATLSPSAGSIPTADPVDLPLPREPPHWYSASPRRTRTGATGASTVSSPSWASSLRPPASGRS